MTDQRSEKRRICDYISKEARGRPGQPELAAAFNPPADPIKAKIYKVPFEPGSSWSAEPPPFWWVVVIDTMMDLYRGDQFNSADEVYRFHLGVRRRTKAGIDRRVILGAVLGMIITYASLFLFAPAGICGIGFAPIVGGFIAGLIARGTDRGGVAGSMMGLIGAIFALVGAASMDIWTIHIPHGYIDLTGFNLAMIGLWGAYLAFLGWIGGSIGGAIAKRSNY
jgi:hypothetical protein